MDYVKCIALCRPQDSVRQRADNTGAGSISFYRVNPLNLRQKGVILAAYVCERSGWDIYEGNWQELTPGIAACEIHKALKL